MDVTGTSTGSTINQGANQAYQCIENVKMNRATVAGIKSQPDSLFLLRAHFEESVFDLDKLSQAGK